VTPGVTDEKPAGALIAHALAVVVDPVSDHVPASHAVQVPPFVAVLFVVPATQAVQPLNVFGPVNAAVPAKPAAHVSVPGVAAEYPVGSGFIAHALGAAVEPSADQVPASHAVQVPPFVAVLFVVPATQAVQPLNVLGPVNKAVPA
jgi:hypothetical protein